MIGGGKSETEAVTETPILALVTCGPHLETALVGPSLRTVSVVRLGGVAPRSTLLLAAVDLLVEDAGISPGDIGKLVVSRGPGSFTGIRAGLATVAGLAAATGAECVAYDSLLMQAARCPEEGTVWSAQPGRRGEVYARAFVLESRCPPRGVGEIEVVSVADAHERGPWVASEALDLGRSERALTVRGAAESLLLLTSLGVESEPLEPLYVEGPPIHQRGGGD
ncbi:MAG: tRNA (adenosine(37)-N6)-threonylcarbamoyltransferase complex dimerization subunit type 1 TsaB [Thermoanaerobaculales bacterium]